MSCDYVLSQFQSYILDNYLVNLKMTNEEKTLWTEHFLALYEDFAHHFYDTRGWAYFHVTSFFENFSTKFFFICCLRVPVFT